MKSLLLLSILFLFLSINSKAQCELMKVEIKDTTVKKALKEYIGLGYKYSKLPGDKGIVLLQISRGLQSTGNDGHETGTQLCVSITWDNHYKEFQTPYTNYTIIDDEIVLIEYEGQEGIIKPSKECSKCIDKIVGNKVKQFPAKEEYWTTLPLSNKRVKMIKERKSDTYMGGCYYIDLKGNYIFRQGI
ncbi:hypothetical protein VB264_00740 [Arcicella aquatica]|uniref:Uncharacterized protein n=1 Tax=Arcicella aquatica TaxID=217141 RepID=A0ABU5QGW9_9BACT|nr:hypothetical protein [Arcicella aquatica]MEA5256290.1 hypothetical protein [Arcicella aquatica]